MRYIAVAMLAVLAGCGREAPAERPPKAVRVEAVSAHEHRGGARYSANVEPREQVAAAFRVGGYVETIGRRKGIDGAWRHLQEGDTVRRGEMLARLRETEYRASALQTQAAVAESKAGLEKARLDAERAEELYASKSMTKLELDAAKAGLDSALARAAGAEAQHEGAEQSLADCSLRSPLDGVVLDRTLEVGQLVGTGSSAFVLADVRSVKAVFGVPDHVVKDLKVGAPIPVRTEVLGSGEFQGIVTAVSPAADVQSRVFEVEVTIPNAAGQLKPGMIATVEITTADPDGEAEGTPAIPLTAVVKSEGGGYSVFVVDGEGETRTARSRKVVLGGIAGNRIAVREGLKTGERIVSLGSTLLADGDAVRVIP